jgi:hypothetical protein
VAAGHVIECGAQATGGNYSFFTEVPSWPAGFPIAEVAADGSSVITKPPGSGGLVSVGTVTSQLVYEIAGPEYANPDVTALFDTIELAPAGPDRVEIRGVRGAPAPERLKVAVNLFAGFRNTMSLVLTGRDAAAKADLALRMIAGIGIADALGDPGAGRPAPSPRELARASSLDVSALHVAFEDVATGDPDTTAAAQGHLRITVKDLEQRKVGKPFTTAVVESALGCYPGMFPTAPPAEGSAYGIYWPTLIDRSEVRVSVTVDGEPVDLGAGARPVGTAAQTATGGQSARGTAGAGGAAPDFGYVQGAVLGDVVGARSGDKGGNANVGVWIPEPGVGPSAGLSADEAAARYAWLERWLTPDKVRELLPEAADLAVDVYPLPNLRAVNVVIRGLLGSGVADSTSLDPQAKGLAEHLRARRIR